MKTELPKINVLEAIGPKAGLEAVEATYPDVIVADYRMPEMDGLTFLQKARQRRPYAFLILITGADESEYQSRASALGVDDILPKPFPPEALLALLARHLRLERSLPTAARPSEPTRRKPGTRAPRT